MLIPKHKIILGSQSPRRKEILKMAGIEFSEHNIGYEESIPENIADPYLVPVFLAREKALHARGINKDDLLITADTLVFLDGAIIGKPRDKQDAFDILQRLSGNMHIVVTGVCLKIGDEIREISDLTRVWFKTLDLHEVEYYIENFNVMDKAGAYGVQDWIGLIGIDKMEGSYFNVMGFPIHKVYEELKEIENQRI